MTNRERLRDFRERLPSSAPGKFYVDDQCLDCDLCLEIAPTVFRRDDPTGRSYVFKQPESDEEFALAKEAVAGCCTEAIRADGDTFDGIAHPPMTPYDELSDAGKKARARADDRARGRIRIFGKSYTLPRWLKDLIQVETQRLSDSSNRGPRPS
jgi:ferredoxin